jgi:lia operon protein LiaG
MKKQLTPLIFFVLLLFSSAVTLAQNVLVDTKKSYSNIKTIEVNGGWLDVSYEGGSDRDVNVNAYLASNDNDQDIVFVKVGDVLKISLERKQSNYSWNSKNKGYIKISGPEGMELKFRNSSGTLSVDRIKSNETSLQVSSGRIKASNLSGDVYINATSGNLQISQVQGNVQARLTSGNATINQIVGNVDYESTSGSLEANEVKGILSASLTSGNAKLNDIESLGKLRFTSGNIRATMAGLSEQTQFSGTSGNFTIQTKSDLKNFNYSLKASSGNLRVGNIRTGKTLEISNGAPSTIRGNISSGNITIEN